MVRSLFSLATCSSIELEETEWHSGIIVGLPLAASVDDEQTENDLSEYRQQAKLIFRRLNETSETRCSIESGKYTLQLVNLDFFCLALFFFGRRIWPTNSSSVFDCCFFGCFSMFQLRDLKFRGVSVYSC
jgi:hypothetical protein